MPRGLNNWSAGAIIRLLRDRGFRQVHSRGSHFYYAGKYAGQDRLVSIPIHGKSGTIAVGTMKSIVRQSGIPESEWRS